MLGKYVKESKDPITEHESAEVMNNDRNLLQVLCEGDLDWLTSPTLMELIQFKWASFGYNFNLFGCIVHLAYILSIFVYVDIVYLMQMAEHPVYEKSEGDLRMLKAARPSKLTKQTHINNGKIEEDVEIDRNNVFGYSVVLLLGILYPTLYEIVKMWK